MGPLIPRLPEPGEGAWLQRSLPRTPDGNNLMYEGVHNLGHDHSKLHKAMILLIVAIVTVWIFLTVLVLGVCQAARLGDQAQQRPYSPCTSHSDPHVVGNHSCVVRRHPRAVIFSGELHSPRDLSAR